MASSSGTSSGSSSQQQNSGDLLVAAEDMELRKRKRMLSNRESARRSRFRKQKHLQGLNEQSEWLRAENGRVAASLSTMQRHSMAVEAENSMLRTQMEELKVRLYSLVQIIGVSRIGCHVDGLGFLYDDFDSADGGSGSIQVFDSIVNPWEMTPLPLAYQYC